MPSVLSIEGVFGLKLMPLGVGYLCSCPHDASAHLPILACFSMSAIMMVQVNGKDAKTVKNSLANEHGIMVRHYQKKMLDGFIRISVGRPEHTDALILALQNMV
jgi:histidinol-phosphate/aromatic aminotransferase/cobyric acid decarboxylase-like protein